MKEQVVCVSLFIHMSTGETEVITKPKVTEKMDYIDETYNADLIHSNCAEIYIENVVFSTDTDGMDFGEAFLAMKQGQKIKLPNWAGYWAWEDDTIMMHTKEGVVIDLLDTEMPEYTF